MPLSETRIALAVLIAYRNSIGGSDSTASALRIVLAFLLVTPVSYAKISQEIQTASSNGQISSPVVDVEAKTLPYVQAVIKESLRMLPPATSMFYKKVPKGGDEICGYSVPEGTWVGHCMYGVEHKKSLWGEDADVFRPERWLEAHGEKLKEMNANVSLVFGYGKYICLGQDIAMTQLNKAVIEVSDLPRPMVLQFKA
jgi:cytochrome P450